MKKKFNYTERIELLYKAVNALVAYSMKNNENLEVPKDLAPLHEFQERINAIKDSEMSPKEKFEGIVNEWKNYERR